MMSGESRQKVKTMFIVVADHKPPIAGHCVLFLCRRTFLESSVATISSIAAFRDRAMDSGFIVCFTSSLNLIRAIREVPSSSVRPRKYRGGSMSELYHTLA